MVEQAQGMAAGQMTGQETITASNPPTDGDGANPSREKMVAAGSIIGGLAAMSCCILPLSLFSLGAGGAWIGNLTALSPYQPVIIAVTVGFLGLGYYLVYRKPKAVDCNPDSYCASPQSTKVTKIALWTSTVFVIAAVAFNILAPLFLDTL